MVLLTIIIIISATSLEDSVRHFSYMKSVTLIVENITNIAELSTVLSTLHVLSNLHISMK